MDGVRVGWVILRWRVLAVLGVLVLLGVVALYPLPLVAGAAGDALATLADIEPGQVPAAARDGELERGLNRRLARWTYTVAMLPPDIRRGCVAWPADQLECRLVTGAALLREQGVALTFTEDAQGFLARVAVQPYSRWRLQPGE